MSTANNLIVPVVLWGKLAPTHCISAIYLAKDQKTLATGCNDGQICVWDVDDNLEINPRCLLFGHTAPVICLARGSVATEACYLVSSSENGEMCVWDLTDGRCLETVKLGYIHTSIQSYQMAGASDVRLFCNGYYADIIIMDAFSLEILFTLASKVIPDWISAIHILRPAKTQDDVVVGLSVSGTIKVWTINAAEIKGVQQLYENESKPIRCLNALRLTCCVFNQRTMLVVCTKYWQIFDAGDFSLLCSVSNRCGERWAGGDFVAADRILVWSDKGKGYIYKLPTNKPKGKAISCVVGNREFHNRTTMDDQAFLYCVLSVPESQPLTCPPTMSYLMTTRGHFQRLLLRGDCAGTVAIWSIPEVTNKDLSQMQQEQLDNPPELTPKVNQSLQDAWTAIRPPPPGILDQLDQVEGLTPKLTSSIFLPLQGRLVCGREDGSIVIVPATQSVMLQLLHGKHHQYRDWPPHQVLYGHGGAVTCLQYPHHHHSRYDIAYLVSGGVDFSVCLWDIYTGALLHTFCVHAGEITQLLVPPNNCNSRIQNCICSVASDHSVALLGLKERKCIMLASRHLFPVQIVKWRPLDDFMVVGCTDGTVYVWQMETGHLDRYLHGLVAEEVLSACDETIVNTAVDAMANPAIHFFRGLRHRNLAAIRHAAQRGLHHLAHSQQTAATDASGHQKIQPYPLLIQGLKTNPKDYDSHVLFFDIEALIVQLLSEEYSTMSPAALEAQGLIITQLEHQKVSGASQTNSPDTQRKLAGFIARVRDTAENVGQKIQAKVETVGFKPSADTTRDLPANKAEGQDTRRPGFTMVETNLTMEIAQLLLSFLHGWGLDPDLDRVCENKLGLLRPLCPISFGLLSRGGFMSLLLPMWQKKHSILSKMNEDPNHADRQVRFAESIPAELLRLQECTLHFMARGHWEMSTAITTHHLIAVISIANTLMSMNCATFIPEQETKRRLLRRLSRMDSKARLVEGNQEVVSEDESSGQMQSQQAQIKQGWSLLAALHCILLPEKVGTSAFKRPQVEMLARRWQDRCLEVREAAQALLLAELRRIGTVGRKDLVEEWAPYLPSYFEPFAVGSVPPIGSQAGDGKQGIQPKIEEELEEEDDDENTNEDSTIRKPSSAQETKRRQATAIVLLGVIGAEFGQDIEQNRRKNSDEHNKKSIVEGFGVANYSLSRHTSRALAYLLLAAPSEKLPPHTPLRRAAIDLLGRGFTVWEPYIDVSKILLGLLELCCDSDKMVHSMTYGLPLTPAADSCRTARHSLSLIATARPPAFITTMAKEVARYNTLAQNAQTLNINLAASVLNRAKAEILRVVEILIEKMQTDVADLIVEVMDITLHCLDHNQLKSKGLNETFPAICRFYMVSYCGQTRRVAVGARNGSLAIYELRAAKCQVIPAHATPVTACCFSPDGKFLASYSSGENKLCFWQTATGLFGLGNSQTRCVRTHSTVPLPDAVKSNPLKMARLVWITNKTATLMLLDGSEYRFSI